MSVPFFDQPRYQVVGAAPGDFGDIADHQPGDVFEADIPAVQEQRLIAGGHLRRLPDKRRPWTPRLDDPQPEAGKEK